MKADIRSTANVFLEIKNLLASLDKKGNKQNWFNNYRATTGVEKPICTFPTEKVALGELLAPGHLAS